LLTPEAVSQRARNFIGAAEQSLIVSNLAAAEFASAISRRVRTREFTADQARLALSGFDSWLQRLATTTEIISDDVTLATALLRRLDLPLRTLDALHLAIAQRLDATLVAFDQRMIASARALGMAVALP